MTALLSSRGDRLGPISLRVHDTEKPEGFIMGVPQLVDSVRRDVDGVEIADPVGSPSESDLSPAPYAHHHVLMPVTFEAAVSSW